MRRRWFRRVAFQGGFAGPQGAVQIPPLCRKTFPRESRRTADLSTALRFGRDDKGEGSTSILHRQSLLNRSRFSSPWVGRRPMTSSGWDDKGRGAAQFGVVGGSRETAGLSSGAPANSTG